MGIELRAVTVFAICAFGACVPEKPGGESTQTPRQIGTEEGVVVAIGADEITVGEYRARVQAVQSFPVGPRTLDSNLDAVVAFELLADEAERRGYGHDPRVVDDLKNTLADTAARGQNRAALVKTLRAKAEVTTDDVALKRAFEGAK